MGKKSKDPLSKLQQEYLKNPKVQYMDYYDLISKYYVDLELLTEKQIINSITFMINKGQWEYVEFTRKLMKKVGAKTKINGTQSKVLNKFAMLGG